MSGGHYDYKCHILSELAQEISADVAKYSEPGVDGYGWAYEAMDKDVLDHMRFVASKLEQLSKAVHDIEWLMSGDISEGSLRKADSWGLSREFRQSSTADPVSLEWLDRTLAEWPKKQPGKGGSVPPSSPKHKLVARWNHWVVGKKIDPAILYLACWKYQNAYFNNGNYIKALMNFLSPSAAMVPEWLDWAKTEAKRQGVVK